MIVAWCTAALAADPLLDGLPGADGVVVTRGASQWTVEVRGRSVAVDPVRDDADRAALRALVRALLAEVEVPAVPSSALASRAMAALGPPPAPAVVPAVVPPAPMRPPTPAPEAPPRPVVEPVAGPAPSAAVPATPAVPAVPPVIRTPAVPPPEVRPPSRGRASVVSVGPELVVREGLGVGPGAAVVVSARGLGARASIRPTRPVEVAAGAGVGELALDLTAWTRSDPVSVGLGVGAVGRRYVTDGVVVAAHVVPRVDLGAAAALPIGGWRLEPGVAVEVDLLRTRMGWDVATRTLSPMGFRTELRLGRSAKKIEPGPDLGTPEGEPEPRGVH